MYEPRPVLLQATCVLWSSPFGVTSPVTVHDPLIAGQPSPARSNVSAGLLQREVANDQRPLGQPQLCGGAAVADQANEQDYGKAEGGTGAS